MMKARDEHRDQPSDYAVLEEAASHYKTIIDTTIDAMPGGGVLTVSTALERDATWGVIRVTDTGEGIEEEHINQLFDPFLMTKEVGNGTGLGLSVSYGLIQEHGGRIEVSSQPGKGTEFQIYLPVNRQE